MEITGYQLSRAWFDFAFENQGKVTGNHCAMLMWFIELNNRMGWVKEFGIPRDQTMAAVGISSYNTYKKVFNDLVAWGFVNVVRESRNQFTANVIALSKIDKADKIALSKIDKPLDKALKSLVTKQVNSTVALNKPLNKETSKPLNKETLSTGAEKKSAPEMFPSEELGISFKSFWDAYDKKVGKVEKLQKKWENLKVSEKQAVMAYVPKYKLAQPNKQYRKNPETFLNNRGWEDELICNDKNLKDGKNNQRPPAITGGNFGKL
ncbi:hypothetical protein BCY91_14040 [Pelobium manganitolerans]|uniref:Lin1244/Lin1753-like N-terminal domain-containing protein n=1 Tax=Pelobium manganitolerans TaxID=1842495 RepID=A0A419S9W5_9SPHI|nr:hypothetical protein [Pelobium manganitolerans]RKD18993.1 hypothetical protein BCY91_14040 [Pelobium manganitolerans]